MSSLKVTSCSQTKDEGSCSQPSQIIIQLRKQVIISYLAAVMVMFCFSSSITQVSCIFHSLFQVHSLRTAAFPVKPAAIIKAPLIFSLIMFDCTNNPLNLNGMRHSKHVFSGKVLIRCIIKTLPRNTFIVSHSTVVVLFYPELLRESGAYTDQINPCSLIHKTLHNFLDANILSAIECCDLSPKTWK